MSRRPGIAAGWFKKFVGDVYPSDFLIMNGIKMRPPRYYDGLFEIIEPFAFDDIKAARRENALKFVDNNTLERLAVREQIQVARLSRLTKTLE